MIACSASHDAETTPRDVFEISSSPIICTIFRAKNAAAQRHDKENRGRRRLFLPPFQLSGSRSEGKSWGEMVEFNGGAPKAYV